MTYAIYRDGRFHVFTSVAAHNRTRVQAQMRAFGEFIARLPFERLAHEYSLVRIESVSQVTVLSTFHGTRIAVAD